MTSPDQTSPTTADTAEQSEQSDIYPLITASLLYDNESYTITLCMPLPSTVHTPDNSPDAPDAPDAQSKPSIQSIIAELRADYTHAAARWTAQNDAYTSLFNETNEEKLKHPKKNKKLKKRHRRTLEAHIREMRYQYGIKTGLTKAILSLEKLTENT